jgi:hypothetical protein
MNYVLHMEGKLGQQPAIQHWGSQQRYFKQLKDQLFSISEQAKAWGCTLNILILAHEQYDKDEATGIMEGNPLATGKLAPQLPLWFDECYRMVMIGQGDKAQRAILTRPERGYPAFSSLDGLLKKHGKPGLPSQIPPDYNQISAFVLEAQQALTAKATEDQKGAQPSQTQA